MTGPARAAPASTGPIGCGANDWCASAIRFNSAAFHAARCSCQVPSAQQMAKTTMTATVRPTGKRGLEVMAVGFGRLVDELGGHHQPLQRPEQHQAEDS